MNAVVTTRPAMPVAAKYRTVLSREIGDCPVLADNDTLIPIEDCRAIVAEMSAALVRCDPEVAAKHARMIIGAYGGQKPDDPEIYARMATVAVSQCPADLLVKLVETVTIRHPRFLWRVNLGEKRAAI